ncbi:enoyl-CoA hydratase-related protein [Billgrantia tianxiuensis]|uniref:enoyl-CoA hydratase-related protein n=1 Tax=Billgrantia tianxiuensis TaxID=2497861 RepID=UPI0024143D51|nr:enoyl-CoA hydratase-related protein [Halomonas tianxiuensis]
MTSPVAYQRHDEFGVITIDNPPVNALGQAVRQGLMEAVSQGNDDPQVQVLVLHARGRTFIAGPTSESSANRPKRPSCRR